MLGIISRASDSKSLGNTICVCKIVSPLASWCLVTNVERRPDSEQEDKTKV